MAIYDMATAIRGPSADGLIDGYRVGQQMAERRRLGTARNALARLAQGDQAALPELMQADPEAGMKWQDMQRAEETRKGLQGFFRPAQAELTMPSGNPIDNSLKALAGGFSLAPTIEQSRPASFDAMGATNFLASRGDANALEMLLKAQNPDKAEFGMNPQVGINPETGNPEFFVSNKQGRPQFLGIAEKPQAPKIAGGFILDSDGMPAAALPMTPAQQAADRRAQDAANRPQLVQGTDANGNPTYEWVQPGQQPTVAPTRKEKTLSPTEFKELVETEDKIGASQSVITSLDDALRINDLAYSGPAALSRAKGRSLLGGDTRAADATVTLNNIISEQALASLKTIFGGNPTEGERAILLEMQASVEKTPAQRAAIIARAKAAAERRLQASRERAEAIRGGTFSKPGGGKQPAQSGVRKDTSGLVNWLQGRNINNQDQFNQAVTEMKRRGWNEAEINQALDKAGL